MSFLSSIIVLPFYSLKRAEVLNLSFRPPVRTLVPYLLRQISDAVELVLDVFE